jgi:hypothetical protein
VSAESSGLQARHGPGRAGVGSRPIAQGPCPSRTIVDAKLAFHPQLHGFRIQAKAAPMRRPRHIHSDMVGFGSAGPGVGDAESSRRAGHRVGENLPRLDGPALFAGPGAEAALPCSGAKIGVVLGVRQQFDRAFGAHLTVAMIPVKNHCGPAIGNEFAALARLIVGVENDVSRLSVDLLAKDDPRRRVAALVHRRKNHGIGIGLGGVESGLRQPLGRDDEGIPRQGVG